VWDQRLSPGDGWNDGFGAGICQQASQSIGVVGLIRNEPLDRTCGGQEFGSHHDVVDIARRDQQDPGPAERIGQRVDRGRAAPTRTPDRLIEGPPFPLAAERCAFTCELSIEAVPITPVLPVLPVMALNIANQMP
jgi:hypothetical protein